MTMPDPQSIESVLVASKIPTNGVHKKSKAKRPKPKKRGKHFDLYCPVYRIHIHVSIDETDEQVIKSIGNELGDDIKDITGDNFIGGKAYLHENAAVIRLRGLDAPVDFGTLSHEVFHMTHFILDHRRIKFSLDVDEAFAYFNGWLFENIISEWLKVRPYQKIALRKV